MKELTQKILKETTERYPQLAVCEKEIVSAYELLQEHFEKGGALFACGNGGSASDCAHLAGELLKSFKLPRPLPERDKRALAAFGAEGARLASRLQCALPVISLCEQTAFATAFSNDVEGTLTYAQLVYALAGKDDLLLCISTSGNAENCIYAAYAAKSKGLPVLSLTGETGGRLKGISSVCICVPERETYRVQELHLPVYHCLCAMLEAEFFG